MIPLAVGDLPSLLSGDLAETRAAFVTLSTALQRECIISRAQAEVAANNLVEQIRSVPTPAVAVMGSHLQLNSSSSGSNPSSSSSSGKSYAAAADTFKLKKVVCGMPTFTAVINEMEVIICLDTGCEVSTVSESELQRRWDELFAPGSEIQILDLALPSCVNMYAGGHTVFANGGLCAIWLRP
jgi:hypothetical protein